MCFSFHVLSSHPLHKHILGGRQPTNLASPTGKPPITCPPPGSMGWAGLTQQAQRPLWEQVGSIRGGVGSGKQTAVRWSPSACSEVARLLAPRWLLRPLRLAFPAAHGVRVSGGVMRGGDRGRRGEAAE